MTEDKKAFEAAQREMVTTSGGTPLPTGVDRRSSRRSRKTHNVFKAIKAEHSGETTRMQFVADWLTNLASSSAFFICHVIGFATWLLWNSPFFGLPRFDPFPYGLLTMIVSLEAIFLSIFVLMSQNRESAIAEVREEVSLAVTLRVEEEVTKVL